MGIRELVDLAIDEDPRSPCLWVPGEQWEDFCQAVQRKPNIVGVVIYRNKTVRQGEPFSDITTRSRTEPRRWPAIIA
ncbi:MAG TPA: hypothetical protein VHY34_04225 [Caulobacteraceae bacterium]|jgi:hypothetical protein|nr:hypothetical protein [Caulobacteraceae bacterium]